MRSNDFFFKFSDQIGYKETLIPLSIKFKNVHPWNYKNRIAEWYHST